jgi:hypothetical protein
MTYKKQLRFRRKQYNMTAMFEEEAKMMKTKKLTTHPPARVMPTSRGISVLGGNHINNS